MLLQNNKFVGPYKYIKSIVVILMDIDRAVQSSLQNIQIYFHKLFLVQFLKERAIKFSNQTDMHDKDRKNIGRSSPLEKTCHWIVL